VLGEEPRAGVISRLPCRSLNTVTCPVIICFCSSLVTAIDVVADVKPPTSRLPGLERQVLFVLLVALPGEAEEHQHDAEVDDVAAVAAALAADEADQRGDDVGAGGALADLRRRG
jgi:hypothetical protein